MKASFPTLKVGKEAFTDFGTRCEGPVRGPSFAYLPVTVDRHVPNATFGTLNVPNVAFGTSSRGSSGEAPEW